MDFKKSKSKGKSGNFTDMTGVTGIMRSRLNDLFDFLMMPQNFRQSEGDIRMSSKGGGGAIHQPEKPDHPLSPNRDRPLQPVDSQLLKEIMFNKLFYPEDPRVSYPEEPDVLRQPDFREELRKMRRHSTIYDKE